MSVRAESLPTSAPIQRLPKPAVRKLTQRELEAKPLLTPVEMALHLDWSRSYLDMVSKSMHGFPVLRAPHKVQYPWREVVEFLAVASRDHRPLPSSRDSKRKPRGRK